MKKLYYVLACLFCVAACSKNDGDGGKGSFVPSDVCFVDTLYNELESAGNVEVKIRLAEPATGDFSVEVIASVENDMVEGEDYVFDPLCPVKKGEQEVTLNVTLEDNRVADPGRFLELRILDAAGGKVLEPSTCRLNIIDDESQCAIVFRDREMEGYEGEMPIRVPICVTGTMSGNVNFKVKQVGGTAVEGTDYTWKVAPEFVIENLSDTVYLEIQPVDDQAVSPNKTLVLEIAEAEGGDVVTSRSNCLVHIIDNDIAVKFESEAYGVAETDKLLLIPVCLSQPIREDLEVNVRVAGGDAVEGSDFTVEKTVVIPAGRDSVRLVLRPSDVEGIAADKEVVLQIEGCSNPHVQVAGTDCQVTIYDCDSPLSILKAEALQMDEALTVEVGLEEALAHDVQFRLYGDSDLLAESTSFYTIPAGETKVQVELPAEGLMTFLEDMEVHLYDVYGATGGTALPARIIYPLNPSEWSIAKCTSEHDHDGDQHLGIHLIDGNEVTYWQNESIFPKPSLPVEVVVDLGKPRSLTDMNLVRRLNNAGTKKVEVYTTTATTLDDAEWTLLTTFTYTDDVNDSSRKYHWEERLTTQFIRLKVTDAEEKIASLAELVLYGD